MTRMLLESKFHIPAPRVDWVQRPRVTDKLNQGMRVGHLFTLVSAPAGFGKTSIVSEWIHKTARPFTWLSLDQDDNDLVTFLSYFLAALQRVNKDLGLEVQGALEASPAPQADILLPMLISDIHNANHAFTVVLDDYHSIRAEKIHLAVEFLVENLPPRMHFVIVGRTDPPLPLPRLRVGDQITEVRTRDLRFTQRETGLFLNDCRHLDLPPESIRALQARTEGWIASLHLAALSLQGREDKEAFIAEFSGSHYYVMDYLVEEVLSRQPEELRSFLSRSSILGRFCAPLCDDTLQISNSRGLLERIEKANLFLVPLDDKREWYRYHHLFADFLRQHLKRREPEVLPDLHLRAARWYRAHGFNPEAIEHTLSARDYPGAARIIEDVGFYYLTRSEFALVSKWIAAMPRDFVEGQPWLCILESWMRRRAGELDAVDSLLLLAEQGLEASVQTRDETDARRIRAHIESLRAYLCLAEGQVTRAIEHANRAQRHFPPDDLIRPMTDTVLGLAFRKQGNLESALEAFDLSLKGALARKNIFLTHISTWHKGYTQTLAGRLSAALATYRSGLRRAAHRKEGRTLFTGQPEVYIGDILRERNQLEAAAEHLATGIKLCEPTRLLDAVTDGYVSLARVALARGELDLARENLAEAEASIGVPNPDPTSVFRVQDLQNRLWSAEGDFASLAHWTRTCGLSVDDDLDFTFEMHHILLARALVRLGQENPVGDGLETPLHLLRRLQVMAERWRWQEKLLEVLALSAIALQALGEQNGAISTLERSLALAKREGYVRTFLDEGPMMLTLLRRAEQRGLQKHEARRLLAANGKEPAFPKGPLNPAPIEPLSAREMEILRMLSTELSGPEIAQHMSIALSTVRYHTHNIYGKLSVHNRRTAVRRARDLGLL